MAVRPALEPSPSSEGPLRMVPSSTYLMYTGKQIAGYASACTAAHSKVMQSGPSLCAHRVLGISRHSATRGWMTDLANQILEDRVADLLHQPCCGHSGSVAAL